MGDRLAGKVAVVTGGGNGLGRATAVRFAEEGAAVVVADLLDGPGHETVAQIEAIGGRATFVSVDVTSRVDNDAMARTAIEQYDGLHVVVTAAGVASGGYVSGDLELAEKSMRERVRAATPRAAFVNLDVDDWQTVLDVNLTGTLKSLQACVGRDARPRLRGRREPHHDRVDRRQASRRRSRSRTAARRRVCGTSRRSSSRELA